jgi:hypothetical protein
MRPLSINPPRAIYAECKMMKAGDQRPSAEEIEDVDPRQ